jgi:hypothetical protein
MADTAGLVTTIEVTRNTGKVFVQPTGLTTSEIFFLWFFIGTRDIVTGDDVSAFDRVRHSMWIAMLQRAKDAGQQVTIRHDANGSFAFAVVVGT